MIEPLLQAERLLLVGQLDQAEQLYRLTAAHDPQNSIARAGLARVAIERGDRQLALEHARAALAIDAQNEAALRLVARLEELLTTPADRAATDDRPPPPAADAPPGSAAEEIAFTRNPSMADHQRRMQQADQPTAASPPPPAPAAEPARPRRGLIDRLLRRRPGA